jgi:hypothetical protein
MRTMVKVFAGIFAVMAFVVLGGGYDWAGAAPALPLNVQFALKVNVQEDNSVNPPITTFNRSNSTINTSDIIEFIGAELGQTFSDKAKLVYDGGTFKVTDGPSITVVVAGALLSRTLDNTNYTLKGQANSTTGKLNYAYNYAATITYGPDTAGNSFTFTGLVTENYSYNPTKTSNTWTRSYTIDGFGSGVREGTKSMQITGGTVKMNGKVTVKIP